MTMEKRIEFKRAADSFADGLIWCIVAAAVASLPFAWITHVVWIVRTLARSDGAAASQMVLGILGVLMPPVGILHGYMIWLGAGA